MGLSFPFVTCYYWRLPPKVRRSQITNCRWIQNSVKFFIKNFRQVIVELACTHKVLQRCCSFLPDIRNCGRKLCEIETISIECTCFLCSYSHLISSKAFLLCYLNCSCICETTDSNSRPVLDHFLCESVTNPSRSQRGKCFLKCDLVPLDRNSSTLDHVSNHCVLLIFENPH